MNDDRKPAKHDLFNSILKQGMTAIVDFSPKHAGVLLPGHLWNESSVQLKFDGVRCRDIVCVAEGVSAGMTFNGKHYTVYLPWSCVYCISFDVDGSPRGIIYQNDIPKEVVDQMVKRAIAPDKKPEPLAPKHATLQGEAKVYDIATARARRAARDGKPAG